MPVVPRHNFIALSAGVAVLSGWAALLVVIALEQPLQPRKESEAGHTGRLAVSVGPPVLNTYGYSGYGLAVRGSRVLWRRAQWRHGPSRHR